MQSADVIILNARIFTGDETNRWAESVAVRGNQIVYVGTNDGAQTFRAKGTRVFNRQGHT